MPEEELLRAALVAHMGPVSDVLSTRMSADRLCDALSHLLGVGVSLEAIGDELGRYGTIRMRVDADRNVARLLEHVLGDLVPSYIRLEVTGDDRERDDLVYGYSRGPIGRIARPVVGLAEVTERLRRSVDAAPRLPAPTEMLRSFAHRDRVAHAERVTGSVPGSYSNDAAAPALTVESLAAARAYAAAARGYSATFDHGLDATAADTLAELPPRAAKPKKRKPINRFDVIAAEDGGLDGTVVETTTVAKKTKGSAVRLAWMDAD